MFAFSKVSEARLMSCDARIIGVAREAIKHTDFTIICGYRDEATQNSHFDAGASKVKWPNSRHNRAPSHAVDIAPYHRRYGILFGGGAQLETIIRDSGLRASTVQSIILKEYYYLAGVFMTCAQNQGVQLRWGGDWDRDRDLFDQTFNDLGHFELWGEG